MKPTVVYTRPRDWERGGYSSDVLDMTYVPISGEVPLKRNGRYAGDGIGDVVTKKGLDLLIEVIKEKKPDFFFHAIHAKITHPTLEKIRHLSPKTRIIVADGNGPGGVSRYVKEHRDHTDAVLLNSRDPKVREDYLKIGFKGNQIGTLYDGFDPKEHVPSKREPDFDVFFAGSNLITKSGKHIYPNGHFRFLMMSMMVERFKAAIHGYRAEWPFPVRPHLSHPKYFPAFQTAKIVLNVNHLDLERYYTRRTIHCGASGRMYLLKYIPGMENDFENHKHLVWVKTPDQAVEQVDRYLLEKKEREEIASAGRALFLEKHTWQARLKEFEHFVLALL
jgi:hypothetical protein